MAHGPGGIDRPESAVNDTSLHPPSRLPRIVETNH